MPLRRGLLSHLRWGAEKLRKESRSGIIPELSGDAIDTARVCDLGITSQALAHPTP